MYHVCLLYLHFWPFPDGWKKRAETQVTYPESHESHGSKYGCSLCAEHVWGFVGWNNGHEDWFLGKVWKGWGLFFGKHKVFFGGVWANKWIRLICVSENLGVLVVFVWLNWWLFYCILQSNNGTFPDGIKRYVHVRGAIPCQNQDMASYNMKNRGSLDI